MPTITRSHESALDDATALFTALRPRLRGIASRVLGRHADAEDVVQDAWIRWQTCDRTRVLNPTAFLVAVTTRLAINAAQSARSRRETSVGEWLTDPPDAGLDPVEELERLDALDHGINLLLQRLSRVERAAFVLRHGFDYPYPAIADVLGLTEVNTRQLVSRAGRRLSTAAIRRVSEAEQHRLVAAVHAAFSSGDVGQLEQVVAA